MDQSIVDTSLDTNAAGYDGRRARRDRNADAVVDAVLSLFAEGAGYPTAQQVADRSGVSLRSVFRYFDDLDALVFAAIVRFRHRHDADFHFEPLPAAAPFEARIDAWVRNRLGLYEATGTTIRTAIARSHRQPGLAELLEAERRRTTTFLSLLFEPELDRMTADERIPALAAAHTVTLFEAWDNLSQRHGLATDQIAPILRRQLWAALATQD